MIKNRALPFLLIVLFVVSCDQKKDSFTSSSLIPNTLAVTIDPAPAQPVEAGSRVPLKASCSNASGEVNASPVWSVENDLGTFEPAQGKETTFIAGKTTGTGKLFATLGSVRGETTVTVKGCPANNEGGSGETGGTGNQGGAGDSGGSGGTGGGNASVYGLFSETYIVPGILLDTDSSRFNDGGCIGVWPDGETTVLSDGGLSGEKSEGIKSLQCDVRVGGGWWIQFGSDALPGLGKNDVMAAKDMSSFANGALKFDVKSPKDVLIEVKWGEGEPLPGAYFTLRELGIPCDGQWHQVSIPLSRFPGIDLRKIKVPASFSAAPGSIYFTYYVDNVRWEK
ncbi:MAG: hypothetical protein ACYC5N_07085 [Endomicrobiales bacterium]